MRFSSAFSNGAMNGNNTGFSHGAFSSNQPSMGYGDSHPRRASNIPALNTQLGQGMQSPGELQTSGTGFDMNYTPLLPSQLLLGSPFQPGSPLAFNSPQFQRFSSLAQQNHAAQQNQVNHMGSPPHQAAMASSMYQNMVQPNHMNGQSLPFGGPPPQPVFRNVGNMGNQFGGSQIGGYAGGMNMAPGLSMGTSRTVYLGNIPQDTPAEEILGHVRSGQIESVRILADKNCAFISFLDASSATHFHSDAILKKLSIRGQEIKVGWGKPSQVPASVALAVQQSGASRNVYLGNLPEDLTEAELREDLGKFGPIDTVKIVREKAIGFVHFLSIGHAIKAVTQLPHEPKWQSPRRVFYGKDRCAYVSKTQQQNAAQYLGIAPGYAHVLNTADRDFISNALAQQSVAAAAVATSAGGVQNLGNRTVYLGNIHPETTIEEICNVVRGGLLHHIRYIPDKHICFVTFIDPTSAASFYALSNVQGLMIHNRRLKIGWGKHSGTLPPAIALAVSGGASRNVYVGNLDESWSEERLRQDFSEYGEIELVNALREKSCAFVNFTNIANAIKAIEAMRGREEYKRFKINFGKDRCGNPPRQANNQAQQQQQHAQQLQQPGHAMVHDQLNSPSPLSGMRLNRSQSGSSPSNSGPVLGTFPQFPTLNTGNSNPLTMYLSQLSAQQSNPQNHELNLSTGHQQQQPFGQQGGLYSQDNMNHYSQAGTFGVQTGNGLSNPFGDGVSPGSTFPVTGFLDPALSRPQHVRATSLPATAFGPMPGQGRHYGSLGYGSISGADNLAAKGYGLAIQEEEIGAQ